MILPPYVYRDDDALHELQHQRPDKAHDLLTAWNGADNFWWLCYNREQRKTRGY